MALSDFFRKIGKLSTLLSCARYRAALVSHGVAAAIEHRHLIQWLAPQTVIDVGANKGQFSLLVRESCPFATILAFEALPSAQATYRALFRDDQLVDLSPVALAETDGEARFFVSNRSDSSSLLRPGPEQQALFGVSESHEIVVKTLRMDETIRQEQLNGRSLLKIDVQGGELSVLRGCSGLLSWIDFVYVECSYRELYHDQPLLPEISDYLALSGFHLIGTFNIAMSEQFGPIQADVLFARSRAVADHKGSNS